MGRQLRHLVDFLKKQGAAKNAVLKLPRNVTQAPRPLMWPRHLCFAHKSVCTSDTHVQCKANFLRWRPSLCPASGYFQTSTEVDACRLELKGSHAERALAEEMAPFEQSLRQLEHHWLLFASVVMDGGCEGFHLLVARGDFQPSGKAFVT
eukprot:1141161-Pelagomonas_calceolata.AAC.3